MKKRFTEEQIIGVAYFRNRPVAGRVGILRCLCKQIKLSIH